MKGDIDSILDECLTQLQSGEATPDECLASYPDQAGILLPLLEMALEVQDLERPEMSVVASTAAKRLMLVALSEKQRREAVSPSAWSLLAERVASLLGGGKGLTARWGRPALIGALATVTVLVWVIASSLFLQTWRTTVVAHTAVLTEATGVVQMQAGPGSAWRPVAGGEVVEAGGRIRTRKFSGVTVSFFDGSSTTLGSQTEITVSEVTCQRDGGGRIIALRQWAGQTSNRVESLPDLASRFEIETVSAVARVQGTEFRVYVAPDGRTEVTVIEGVVGVTAQEATVLVSAGQATTVLVGEAPGEVVSAPGAQPTERPEVSETPEPGETGEPGETPRPAETRKPTETPGPGEAAAPTGTPTSTPMPGATPTYTPTNTPLPPVSTETPVSAPPTDTPVPAMPTNTPLPPTTTHTLVPPMPTDTPASPTPTDTPIPPTLTSTPVPPTPTDTPTPVEVVRIFLARYNESAQRLTVKARSSMPGCALTLVGFGPMEPEGDHWCYIQQDLAVDDVPTTAKVVSSCGGSDESPVD